MPRGVKKSTADKLRQELEKIRKSISDHEEKIAALKEKEKEVLDQIHDAEMESIRHGGKGSGRGRAEEDPGLLRSRQLEG